MKRLYDALCFDMDGTIMKTDVGLTYAYLETARIMGIDDTPIRDPRNFIGPSIQTFCEKFLGLTGDQYIEFDRLMSEYYLKNGIDMQEAYPGIVDLMEEARLAGYKVFICTAKDISLATASLERGALVPSVTFDAMYASLHPDEEKDVILQRLLDEEQIDPQRAVMIGDRFTDLKGGRVCGTHTIGVLYGYGTREEVESCKPDYIAETVADLRRYLLEA